MEKNYCDCEHTYSDDICECELFNKYEEAIRDIKLAIQPVCGGISLETAIEALEKQIEFPVFDISESKGAWKDGYCKCGHYVTDGENHCHACGQKLSWED